MDAKKTAFHVESTVAEKAVAILKKQLDRPMIDSDREKVSGVIKGTMINLMFNLQLVFRLICGNYAYKESQASSDLWSFQVQRYGFVL